jgi:CxxC-x17-CxxC domain-containing protein
MFKNQQFSREEYERKIKRIQFSNREVFNACIAEYKQLRKSAIHRFADLFKTTMSSGNNLINSKNAQHCFTGENLENVKYGIRVIEIKDSMDLHGAGNGAELMYEGVNIGYKDSLIRFSTNTFEDVRNATYCDYCRTSKNIFGCVGLRRKQYCVLNKQYTKEEYEDLVAKIIKHMEEAPYVDKQDRRYPFGEFFPSEFSPFAYNESVAQEYYPTKEPEALNAGFWWRPQEMKEHKITKYQKDLPNNIDEVTDFITQEIIECIHKGTCDEQCTGAFKILDSELQFYRRMHLPIPELCPNCRHYQRIKYRNPLNVRLWDRACSKCGQAIKSPYAPDGPEIVYCESCYNNEVA